MFVKLSQKFDIFAIVTPLVAGTLCRKVLLIEEEQLHLVKSQDEEEQETNYHKTSDWAVTRTSCHNDFGVNDSNLCFDLGIEIEDVSPASTVQRSMFTLQAAWNEADLFINFKVEDLTLGQAV